MSYRSPRLCLALLAALSAVQASASAQGFLVGDIPLAFSTDRVSTLPVDAQALAEGHCGNGGDLDSPGNLGKCRLTVPGFANTRAPIVVELKTPWLPPGGTSQIGGSQVVSLDIVGESVMTSCGVWTVLLSLDPTGPQPSSPLIVKPPTGDSGPGLYASLLKVKALLRLANPSTAKVAEYPLTLGFGLAGPWIWQSPNDFSNLLNLIGQKQCIPVWILNQGLDLIDGLQDEGCPVCMESRTSGTGPGSGLPHN